MKSLLPQLEQVFGPLVDEVTRDLVLPTALRSHDVGRAIDIDKHDTEGARVMKDYLQKRGIPHAVLARIIAGSSFITAPAGPPARHPRCRACDSGDCRQVHWR